MSSSEDPIALFLSRRAAAVAGGEAFDGCACACATADREGSPAVRMVLVKEVGPDGFYVYTNLESRKAQQIRENPRMALCFHWVSIGEQFRIRGAVEPATGARNEAYFAGRPRESQLGAWASPQSESLESRATLLRLFEEQGARFEGEPVPRPPGWGGYRLIPDRIEHWVNRAHRLHERLEYRLESGAWTTSILAP